MGMQDFRECSEPRTPDMDCNPSTCSDGEERMASARPCAGSAEGELASAVAFSPEDEATFFGILGLWAGESLEAVLVAIARHLPDRTRKQVTLMYWRVRKRLFSTLAPSFAERDFALAEVHQLMDACWRAAQSGGFLLSSYEATSCIMSWVVRQRFEEALRQEAHTLVRARENMGARAAAAGDLPGAAALPAARSDLDFMSVATAAPWERTQDARLAPTPSSDPGCGAAGARAGAWEEPVWAATAAATAPATMRRPGAWAAACDPVLAPEAAAATPADARQSSCGSALGEAFLAPAAVAAATPAAARRLSSGVMAGEPVLAVASAAATPATAARSSGGAASAPTPCLMTPATGARRVEGTHPTPNPGSVGATPAPRLLVQFLPRDAAAAERVAAAGGIPHLELDCKARKTARAVTDFLGARWAGSGLRLFPPADQAALAGVSWGGADRNSGQTMAGIFAALGCPAPFQLLYAWEAEPPAPPAQTHPCPQAGPIGATAAPRGPAPPAACAAEPVPAVKPARAGAERLAGRAIGSGLGVGLGLGSGLGGSGGAPAGSPVRMSLLQRWAAAAVAGGCDAPNPDPKAGARASAAPACGGCGAAAGPEPTPYLDGLTNLPDIELDLGLASPGPNPKPAKPAPCWTACGAPAPRAGAYACQTAAVNMGEAARPSALAGASAGLSEPCAGSVAAAMMLPSPEEAGCGLAGHAVLAAASAGRGNLALGSGSQATGRRQARGRENEAPAAVQAPHSQGLEEKTKKKVGRRSHAGQPGASRGACLSKGPAGGAKEACEGGGRAAGGAAGTGSGPRPAPNSRSIAGGGAAVVAPGAPAEWVAAQPSRPPGLSPGLRSAPTSPGPSLGFLFGCGIDSGSMPAWECSLLGWSAATSGPGAGLGIGCGGLPVMTLAAQQLQQAAAGERGSGSPGPKPGPWAVDGASAPGAACAATAPTELGSCQRAKPVSAVASRGLSAGTHEAGSCEPSHADPAPERVRAKPARRRAPGQAATRNPKPGARSHGSAERPAKGRKKAPSKRKLAASAAPELSCSAQQEQAAPTVATAADTRRAVVHTIPANATGCLPTAVPVSHDTLQAEPMPVPASAAVPAAPHADGGPGLGCAGSGPGFDERAALAALRERAAAAAAAAEAAAREYAELKAKSRAAARLAGGPGSPLGSGLGLADALRPLSSTASLGAWARPDGAVLAATATAATGAGAAAAAARAAAVAAGEDARAGAEQPPRAHPKTRRGTRKRAADSQDSGRSSDSWRAGNAAAAADKPSEDEGLCSPADAPAVPAAGMRQSSEGNMPAAAELVAVSKGFAKGFIKRACGSSLEQHRLFDDMPEAAAMLAGVPLAGGGGGCGGAASAAAVGEGEQVDLRCLEDALSGDLGCLLGESWLGLGLDACSTGANGVFPEGLGGRAFQELFP